MKFFSSASALLALTYVSSTANAFSFNSLAKVASIGEKVSKWDELDTGLMQTVIGSVQGMTTDRHIFTCHIQNGKPWNTDNISKRVKRVVAH